jgi:predicted dienelactone hydrolase
MLLDDRRGREIPIRVLRPTGAVRCPLVLFSPGLGARDTDYDYLLRHWASYGFACVFVTHEGTDARLWQTADRPAQLFKAAMTDPKHWVDRPQDLRFALDAVLSDAELKPVIDYERIATAGHSYGSFTALALVGLTFRTPDGDEQRFRDERVRTCVAMSTQPPGVFGLHDDSWSGIGTPVLSMTGTQDRWGHIRDLADRYVAHERIPGPNQFLAVLAGAQHHAFSASEGIGVRPVQRKPHHHGVICAISTAFFEAVLRQEADARDWLGTAEGLVGSAGSWRSRNVNWA